MTKILKVTAFIAVTGITGLVASHASATTNSLGQGNCTIAGYSTTYSACTGDTVAASTAITSSETVAIAATQTVGLITARINALTGPGMGSKMSYADGKGKFSYNIGLDENGKAAGGSEQKIGAWVSGTWSRTIYDKSDDSSFDGNSWNGMLGVDYRFTDQFLAGISAGYEDRNIATAGNEGNEDSNGWTVAPYALITLDKTFSISATGGYSSIDYDVDRLDPMVSTLIKGSTSATRLFGALDINGNWEKDKWTFGGSLGTLYAREKKDGFTETGEGALTVASKTTTLGRVRVGGDVGYSFGNVLPFVKAGYNYDYNDGGSGDSDSLDYGLGMRFNLSDNISGIIEGSGTALKDNLQNYSGTASIRFNF